MYRVLFICFCLVQCIGRWRWTCRQSKPVRSQLLLFSLMTSNVSDFVLFCYLFVIYCKSWREIWVSSGIKRLTRWPVFQWSSYRQMPHRRCCIVTATPVKTSSQRPSLSVTVQRQRSPTIHLRGNTMPGSSSSPSPRWDVTSWFYRIFSSEEYFVVSAETLSQVLFSSIWGIVVPKRFTDFVFFCFSGTFDPCLRRRDWIRDNNCSERFPCVYT